MNRLFAGTIATLSIVASSLGSAFSAEYPNRSIRIVVTFPAGGAVDLLARIIAERISTSLGQPIIVDARPGASGVIASDLVAKANPDGYTILAAAVSHVINPFVYDKLPYDTERDFAPIALTVVSPNVVAIHPSLPVNSVKELIALAKEKPGQINYASSGVGSNAHLSAEMLIAMAKIKMVHIPYKGGPQALTDTVSGAAQVIMQSLPVTKPFLDSKRLKAIAVTSAQRSSLLPGVPAVAEMLPGYESTAWYGFLARSGTPKAIIDRLSDEIGKALKRPDLVAALLTQSADPTYMNPVEFDTFIKAEFARWGKATKDAGLKPGNL